MDFREQTSEPDIYIFGSGVLFRGGRGGECPPRTEPNNNIYIYLSCWFVWGGGWPPMWGIAEKILRFYFARSAEKILRFWAFVSREAQRKFWDFKILFRAKRGENFEILSFYFARSAENILRFWAFISREARRKFWDFKILFCAKRGENFEI